MMLPAPAPVEFYDGVEVLEAAPDPRSASALAQVIAETDEDLLDPAAPELPAERERTLRAPGFAKMPVKWTGETAPIIANVNAFAQGQIARDFADLFAVVEEIEQAARRAGVTPGTGEIGRPDYAAIAESDKEHWVLELSVRLVGWEQQAARYWGEAMMAKVIRQEVFSTGYLSHTGRTIEDRTQAGWSASQQEYYHAVLCALLHKHAAAACAAAERLCQRLKDTIRR